MHWSLVEADHDTWPNPMRRCIDQWRVPTAEEWQQGLKDHIPIGSDAEGWSINSIWVAPGSIEPTAADIVTDSTASIYCIEKKML